MSLWQDTRVLVTGGSGFLGHHLLPRLKEKSPRLISAPRKSEYDLVDPIQVVRLIQDVKPDIVIHMAGRVGGIGANSANPGLFFYENLMMGTQLMEAARKNNVQKFVALGTICAYPKFTPVPFH